MASTEETEIHISAERLRELLLAERKPAALDFGGVDNWQWYGDSLSDHDYFKFVEELGNVKDWNLWEYL